MVGSNLEMLTFSVSCLGLGNSTRREGHKTETERKALLLCYSARLAPEETMLQCVVLLLGGTKGNSHIGLMGFVKPLLNVEEIGSTPRVLLINLISLSWANLKGVLMNTLLKNQVNTQCDL